MLKIKSLKLIPYNNHITLIVIMNIINVIDFIKHRKLATNNNQDMFMQYNSETKRIFAFKFHPKYWAFNSKINKTRLIFEGKQLLNTYELTVQFIVGYI